MSRRAPFWTVIALICIQHVFAGPIRVSFLNTDAAREDTLRAFADAGCEPENLAALRKAIQHYYQTPLALDVTSFPPASEGVYEFAAIGDFISALGTNPLSFLNHPFELNCYNAALLLAEPEMRVTADLQTRGAPYFAIQVSGNYTEWVMPVASLGDVYAIAHPPASESFLEKICGLEFSEKHKTLLAVFYQFQALPLGTAEDRAAAETQEALRRHWTRCGIQFPDNIALVMFHRASIDFHLAVTDHMGVLLKRDDGYLYFEKTGGRGPFLRIEVADPGDVAAYFSTITWPDYPYNFMSLNGGQFLNVPLRPWPLAAPPPAAGSP